jgi:DNA gyrase/topoisomerase IV subunit A
MGITDFFEYDENDKSGNGTKATDLLAKNMCDYGTEVISDRAIADFRDGFKPSQRRIMKAAADLHAYWNNRTVKSARIVGDTMGRYHPHGDVSIYSSMVTMANAEYPAIHGEGNFGSLTDGAAAPRYTEAKISQLGMKMLECDDVTEEVPNYTGEFKEPVVISTRFPYFFVNACDGIAVGLSCAIPAHNLKEVVDAMKVIVKKGDKATVKDIMKSIKGPDYKYGGKILSAPEELVPLYKTGVGKVKYECEYTIKPEKKAFLVTITGYCPGFQPSTFIDDMIQLMKEKKDTVLYVNDSSTKSEPCKLEVMVKSKEVFEEYVHKKLICSVAYRYYTIKRTKSDDPEKDIDTEVISDSPFNLMKQWIEWRKGEETKMCTVEKNLVADKKQKAEWRLLASKNLKTIVKALETEEPVKYLAENLAGLKGSPRALEAAEYICSMKVISLKKVDQGETEKVIVDLQKRLEELEYDIAHIDLVVVRELDKLKPYFRDRKLKIQEDAA